jgi:peptide/nickel transport system permease protein
MSIDLHARTAALPALEPVPVEGAPGDDRQIEARGYWKGVWLLLKRDKFAIVGGMVILLTITSAFVGAPIAAHILGHGPNDIFGSAIDDNSIPVGPWSHVSTSPYAGATGNFPDTLLILGADGGTGRDEFLRLLYGARVSLEVALGAMVLGMLIGVTMGTIAGYFGGAADTVVSRLTEMVMAFPVLLFAIALAATVGDQLNNVTLGFLDPGVLTLILVIGFFSWYYPARIMRALVLSLREKEFVEAARMVGSSDLRIMRTHLLPHLLGPIIVFSTLVIAQTIIFEAGLSFLGVGIKFPTASWGNLLATAPQYYTAQPWLMVWPGLAVLITVLAFNLLGDGLRDAFDPRSSGR